MSAYRDDLSDYFDPWNFTRDGQVDYYELCQKLTRREADLRARVEALEDALEQQRTLDMEQSE